MAPGSVPGNHVLVVFGATGDLARRKLLPGLFRLGAAGLLPDKYELIGSSPGSHHALSGARPQDAGSCDALSADSREAAATVRAARRANVPTTPAIGEPEQTGATAARRLRARPASAQPSNGVSDQ